MANIIESRVTLEDEVFEETIDTLEEPIEVVRPSSYNDLQDLPQVNGVTLQGNKTSSDLGIVTQNDINSAVSAEATLRENADTALGGRIDQEITDRGNADTALGGRIDGEITNRTNADNALGTRIDNEILARQGGDNNLQTQIDAITSKSDVVDVVATYADLQAYDTQHLGNNDVIKVLDDETHDHSQTYYRWNKPNSTWTYIGSEAPYYSKSQIDTQMAQKQDKLVAGSNIQIASDGKTISATDTTYTAGNGLELNGTEFSADTTVLATKTEVAPKLQTEVVAELPTTGEEDKLYLTPKASAMESISGNSINIPLMQGKEAIFPAKSILGSYSQSVYSGKNLFDKNHPNDLQAFINPSGVLAGGGNVNLSVYIPCEPNTTYTVSKSNTGTNNRFCVFETEDEPVLGGSVISTVGTRSGADNNTSYTITTSANAHYLGVFYRVASTTPSESDLKATIQIELGSIATAYEPFVGGMPSPSPSYPQTINFVTGEQNITIQGKNLIYCTPATGQYTNNIESSYDPATGTIRIHGEPTLEWSNFGGANQCELQAGNYTLSIDNPTYLCAITVRFYYEDNSYVNARIAKSYSKASVTFERKVVRYYIYADGMTVDTPIDFSFKLQFEKGINSTEIAPYHNDTYTISLGNTLLRAVGDSADEILNDNGAWKIKRNISSYILNEEISWTKVGNDFFCPSLLGNYATSLLNIISEKLKGVARDDISGESNFVTMSGNGNIRVNIVGVTTATALQELLESDNIECFYISNNPSYETIQDATLISQLNALQSFVIDKGGNTSIVVSANGEKANIEVDYYGVYSDDKYDEWVFVGSYERFSGDLVPVDGGYVLNGEVNPDNEIWKQWNGRLGWGMNPETAPVPAQFNGQLFANGTIIAHNAGDKNHNRHNMHIFEGYAKDNYSRLTMLTDKHNSEYDGKKSFEMYYYTGASHKNSAYGFTKVGSDVKYHSFLFDRDKMIAAGEIDCRFPITLARINPSTDLDSTYSTVEAADTAYEAENQAEANIKCIKYLALKNAPDGTMWYDTARNKIVVKINGAWHDMNTTEVPSGTYDF